MSATKRPDSDYLNKDPAQNELDNRLKVDEAYNEYLAYCKLFKVPIPADKNPFGKYISTKFSVVSTMTRENNIPFRYYPGLFLWKPAREANADFVMKYDSSNRTATGQQQDSNRT
jgi:hypothetical protein